MSRNRRWKQRQKDREKLGWQAKKPGRKARHRDFLTDELVASLPAVPSEYAVRDIEFPPMGVRVRPTGSKTYFFRPQRRGTKKVIFLGSSKKVLVAEARAQARSIERRLANGGSIAEFASASSTRTVADAFKVYFAAWRGTATWRRKIENVFGRNILPHLGHKAITELRAEDFEPAIGGSLTPYGRRQSRYIASAFLTWCTKTGRLSANVLKGLPSMPRPRPTRNPAKLDSNDLGLIWDACDMLPEQWAKAIRLVIALAEPIDNVLRLDADGRLTPEGPVHRHLRPPCFSRAYFMHVAEGCNGLLFVARGKHAPMRFQSRMIERIRTELYWLGRFSMGDVVHAASKHLTDLRQPGMRWNTLHPRAVYDPHPPPAESDGVEI